MLGPLPLRGVNTFWPQLKVRMTLPCRSARNLFTDINHDPRKSDIAGSVTSWTLIYFLAHLADRGWDQDHLRPDVQTEAASVAAESVWSMRVGLCEGAVPGRPHTLSAACSELSNLRGVSEPRLGQLACRDVA